MAQFTNVSGHALDLPQFGLHVAADATFEVADEDAQAFTDQAANFQPVGAPAPTTDASPTPSPAAPTAEPAPDAAPDQTTAPADPAQAPQPEGTSA